ncbi:PH1570 family protein [Pyrococcus horikoshii]|uniref:PH1570-like domain-containing protein n=2 Tax=Pyrococcus horikoshii TaxID=53953 RepID=O59278_PYRHO|nr:PH1570 family protein [Pyrococcus horikoshii]BAA30682.1 152aa long hypothetical protein [Pyrococcus horikoshii OT3]HII60551.1 hypothetical protein [Pyrococcus horikoshii]
MQCEEKLEVFENGFKDEKFNVEVKFYGNDARKVLLAMIYELYLPEYGREYVYPFECAKEFWNIYLEGEEIQDEEFQLKPIKFTSEQVIKKLQEEIKKIKPPLEIKIEEAKIYKTKEGYLAVGNYFILDPRGRLFIFNKPSIANKILKYIWKW